MDLAALVAVLCIAAVKVVGWVRRRVRQWADGILRESDFGGGEDNHRA